MTNDVVVTGIPFHSSSLTHFFFCVHHDQINPPPSHHLRSISSCIHRLTAQYRGIKTVYLTVDDIWSIRAAKGRRQAR